MKKYMEPSVDLLYLENEDVLTQSPTADEYDPWQEDIDW